MNEEELLAFYGEGEAVVMTPFEQAWHQLLTTMPRYLTKDEQKAFDHFPPMQWGPP